MPPNGDEQLYKEVAGASTERLVNGIEKVDGLTPEQEEALDRGGSFALRGTKRKIHRWILVALFWCGLAVVIAILLTLFALVGIYIYGVYSSGTIGAVVENIVGFLFGVSATIAVEFVWYLSTKKKPE